MNVPGYSGVLPAEDIFIEMPAGGLGPPDFHELFLHLLDGVPVEALRSQIKNAREWVGIYEAGMERDTRLWEGVSVDVRIKLLGDFKSLVEAYIEGRLGREVEAVNG